MPRTLAEKIIARAANLDRVKSGDIVTCQVDLAMMHDSGGPRRVAPILKRLGVGVWNPDKVVLVSDHYVPGDDDNAKSILQLTRDWAHANAIKNFHDMKGICHVVLPEHGHLKPGMFVVGGDSHSPTGGAFGCFMFGIGATDLAGVLVTGETWIKVPATIRINLSGKLRNGISAKDINLALCRKLGMGGGKYQVIEFAGSGIENLDIEERMTLCNMTAELGAMTGIIAPDTVTEQYLESVGAGGTNSADWQSDPDANYLEQHDLDLSDLAPQVAAPHSPANAGPVEAHVDTPLDRAYIGACTGAKLGDLHMAATILKGQTAAPNVRLMVAPASVKILADAKADGTFDILTAAGAEFLASGCGICAGYIGDLLGENEVCISSTARNFQGRMGASSSKVYLASPYTVAASAIRGRVTDPRGFLERVAHD
ncbi:MAG: 3-isopropylmalate dehydratase large subunit [Rhizobiales bacterium]|nr:3-isopropylmalate dehydratase large subunit [Hyphomicrobiales bacterium]